MKTDRTPTFASVYDGRMAAFVEARLTCDDRTRPIDVQPDWSATPGAGPDAHHMLVGDGRRTVARAHPHVSAHLVRYSPGRAARQAAAHRRILARFKAACGRYEMEGADDLLAERRLTALALADVACVWAEHPDFVAEWAHFAALDENAPARPIPNIPLDRLMRDVPIVSTVSLRDRRLMVTPIF